MPTIRKIRGRPPINLAEVADEIADDTNQPVTNITLMRLSELVVQLGVSSWTINRWIKAGTFPRPIYMTPASPAVWRVREIEAFLDKRRRSRREKPKPRGALKQQRETDDAC
jgi:predicted DNA-binding transcriptional regulator AlpA